MNDEREMIQNAPRPKPTEVLVLSEIPGVLEALKETVPAHEAIFFHHTPGTVPTQVLMTNEFIIADPPSFSSIADRCTRGSLKWVQSTFAGVDKLVRNSTYREYTCTRLAGCFGDSIAEYCVMHTLNYLRGYDIDKSNQSNVVWGRPKEISSPAPKPKKQMRDLTIGVLGFGDIGFRVGEVFSNFGCDIYTVRRHSGTGIQNGPMWEKSQDYVPDFVTKSFGMDAEISGFFNQCDVVINLLPSTGQTVGLLNRNTLSQFKDGSLLINCGRGDVFGSSDSECETHICAALDAQSGIERCVLDVFTAEPLPGTSSLWAHPKVTITPHNAAVTHPMDVANVFHENLTRWRDGKELKHMVDWDKGY